MWKQLNQCIQSLINNNVNKNHRSFIVLVGDKGRNQVAHVSARPSVLWCYKKELGFTSHRKKCEAKIKRDVKRGIREANDHDPFENRHPLHESKKILGNTFGMLVLQDFKTLSQKAYFEQDAHACYRTSSHHDIVSRFNKCFILSLGSCDNCLILDNELNVLPISRGKDITAIEEECGKGKKPSQLKELQESLADTKPVWDLIKLAKTVDQAQAILTFVIDAIAEKTLSSTVTPALTHGYSNIFVTSPSLENLKTLFEFVFKGMDVLGYEEHLDYDISQSTNHGFNKAIVCVNVFWQHRQTIQYIQPQDAHVLGQAELVIIDEAVAIPLPLVQNLISPYLIFLTSTINGYEDVNENAVSSSSTKKAANATPPKIQSLRKVKLDTPICYSAGDGIEQWLNKLLCLDATISPSSALHSTPHPSRCKLFYISHDTLFSYHPASEAFLQRMMALYIVSHYKNQPNDLQLMADAPAHHLFVLLLLLVDDKSHLPEPLVVVQVALEGNVSRQAILEGLQCGLRAGEGKFAMMSGAPVVWIATHPDYSNMGYGARALQALNVYYFGEYFNLDESAKPEVSYPNAVAVDDSVTLFTDHPTIRLASAISPLLQCLSKRKPKNLDYLGVLYGLTSQILRFWKRAGYAPLYVCQTQSELTGEHTIVMVRGLQSSTNKELGWLGEFSKDFRWRFLTLLSFKFREFSSVMGLSVLEAANTGIKYLDSDKITALTTEELSFLLTPFDLKRLESYTQNSLDYHIILNLLPTVAFLYFEKQLGNEVHLSVIQSSMLHGMGLQRKSVEEVEVCSHLISPLSLPHTLTLAAPVQASEEPGMAITLIADTERGLKTMEVEFDTAGDKAAAALREKQHAMINALDLSKYAINDTLADWTKRKLDGATPTVDVKSKKSRRSLSKKQ
ncbi:DUF699-domain-containing protein [Lactarius quietus]|nr:DUF699-domain-containing protein [Lactarius quietus]